MATKRELNNTFEQYLQQRIIKENAITPGQKKALIDKLRQELFDQGRVPLPSGPVKLDPKHPIVNAALSGRSVTMSGKVIKKEDDQTFSERMQNLPVVGKIAVMAAVVLLPCLLAMMMYFFLEAPAPVAVAATETIAVTVTVTATSTASPTESPIAPTATGVKPTAIIANTPTPTDFIVNHEDIPSKSNDPASIEIMGLSYVLGTGQIKNGIWQPQAAQWLHGSDLRRIIAIPYDLQTADTLSTIPPGSVAKMRLRSGEIVEYKIAETYRVQRQQIEILAEKKPSLAIILSGEPGIERTIIIGNAIQKPQQFNVYSVATESQQPQPVVIDAPGMTEPEPTAVIITNITITNTSPITNITITNTSPITNTE